jgi:trypsin-like peptidase
LPQNILVRMCSMGQWIVQELTKDMSHPGPKFHPTEIESPITEIALMIAGIRDDVVLPLGSGFFIAPYIAVTAKHVVEEFHRQFGPATEMPKNKTVAIDYRILAVQYPRRAEGNAWRVVQLVSSSYHDICFLHLAPENESALAYRFDQTIRLKFNPPAVGEYIAAFGYPSSAAKSVDANTLLIHTNPTTSAGVVTRVFEGQCCKFRNRTRVRREDVVPRSLRRPHRRVR